jgi:hypothetical protein
METGFFIKKMSGGGSAHFPLNRIRWRLATSNNNYFLTSYWGRTILSEVVTQP